MNEKPSESSSPSRPPPLDSAETPPASSEVIAGGTDATIATDSEQRIIFFSAAAEKMFGRAAADVSGKGVECIIPEGLGDGAPAQEIRFTAQPIRHVNRLCKLTGLRPSGAEFPIEAAVSQIEVNAHSVLTAILRDVSDQQQADEVLRRSEEALADFFAGSPIGLMWVTPDGRVERVNQVELDLLGRSSAEVVGRPVEDFHIDAAAVAALLQRLARGETVHDFHLHTTDAEGELRHLMIDANGLWERAALVRSRWFVRDITARMKLESEVLTIVESERQRIGQELHDDLCQQLVAIEFMTEALAKGINPIAPDVALQAHNIAFHLRVAIDRAREIARGMAPSLPHQPDGLMIALQELAERTVRIFGRACRLECPHPVLSPDHTTTIHLFRIAQEAVGNAIKHGQARHIEIKLFMNGPNLVLGVWDDGNGASPDPNRAIGMGLRVMQYRAGAIGGSLVIQRTPSKGTSVVCTVKSPAGERKAGK